jgi:penicillin amidase
MPKSTRKKILSFLGMIVGGIVLGIILSFYLMLKLSVAPTDGKLSVANLNSPVEITFDKMGIPQIWAENEEDAYFALGFQHAADRMFQMDLTRRFAEGKTSEIFGESAIEFDIYQKKIGHYRLAKKALENLNKENRIRLQAYRDGINYYRKNCRSLPFEYRFLPVDFMEWTVLDCLALLSYQTMFSNNLMNRDEFYIEAIKKVGYEKASSLLYSYPDWAPTIVPTESYIADSNKISLPEYSYKPNKSLELLSDSKNTSFQKQLAHNLLSSGNLPFKMTEASNAWVISPERSESGHAILSSDPHLDISRLPQFWYAVGIHVKDKFDIFGITAPGLPYVVMGHNGYSAWAFTVAGIDMTDYIEVKLNPKNYNQYLSDNGFVEFQLIKDSIKTAGDDSLVLFEYKLTDFGVVVEEDSNNNTAYLLRWAGFDKNLNNAVTSGFNLPNIDSYESFQTTVTGIGALDVNMMYADAKGNIGYQLTSPIPKRTFKDNLPLSYPENKSWNGFYNIEKTPQSLNPYQGWLASCNNLPMRSDIFSGYYFYNRILRIHELLNSKEKFNKDDMMAFQFDRTNNYLLKYKEMIVDLLNKIDQPKKAELINNWNGNTSYDSKETPLVMVFRDELKRATFADELGDIYSQIPFGWMDRINQLENAGWFDDVTTEEIEAFEHTAQKALLRAVELTDSKSWGDMQFISMQHPMADLPIIGSFMSLQTNTESHSGTPGTLNASFVTRIDSTTYRSVAGPSMRFVVDFANVDEATIVLPAGNSGNPMSDHFLDFYEMWKNNERWNVPLSREKVEEKTVSRLMLIPEEEK